MKMLRKIVILIGVFLVLPSLAVEGTITQQSPQQPRQQGWAAWGRGKLADFYQRFPYPAAYIPGSLSGLYGAGKLYNLYQMYDSYHSPIQQEAINQFGAGLKDMLAQYKVKPDWYIEQIMHNFHRRKFRETPIRGWLLDNPALDSATKNLETFFAAKAEPYIAETKSGFNYLISAALLVVLANMYNEYQRAKLESERKKQSAE